MFASYAAPFGGEKSEITVKFGALPSAATDVDVRTAHVCTLLLFTCPSTPASLTH